MYYITAHRACTAVLIAAGLLAPSGALFAYTDHEHGPPARVTSRIEQRLQEVHARVHDRVADNRARVCERLMRLEERLGKNLRLPPFCRDDGGTPPSPPPSPTLTLTATPNHIIEGETSTIAWNAVNATICVATDGWIGNRSVTGNEEVMPDTTTTYTLACGGEGGTTTKSVTVMVDSAPAPQPLPVVDLTVDDDHVEEGATTTLLWTTVYADTCVAEEGWLGARATSGSEIISPITTTTYTLVCSNASGTSSDSVTVEVVAAPTPVPLPTVDVDADPMTINEGGTSTVSWMSTNADSCTASDGFAGPRATSGDEVVTPTATTTYTITCSNASGTSSDSVTVGVIPAAPSVPLPTVDISADELSVPVGGTSTLSWTSTNASACIASGAADFNGAITTTSTGYEVTVLATTTYAIECSNITGTSSDSITVDAVPVEPALVPLPTVDLSADPLSVPESGTSSLSWSSTDADTCTASGAVDFSGPVATTSVDFTVTVLATTSYHIECGNVTGISSDSVEVVAEVAPAPVGTVVINEVLFNPGPSGVQGTDSQNEWVEIYNGTGNSVDINGWTLHDRITGTATDTLATTSTMVPVDGFVIVTRSTTTDNFWSYPGGTIVIYLDEPLGSAGLSNGGEAVVLRDDAGTIIDGVSWGTDTSVLDPSVDLTGIVEGNSISRSPLGTDTDSNVDWTILTSPSPGE